MIEMKLFTPRLNRQDQSIKVQEKLFGYFPKVFSWQGQCYHVLAVEHCWSTRRPLRLNFRVRCREGLYDLYQDVRADLWRVNTRSIKTVVVTKSVRRNIIGRLLRFENKSVVVS